MVSADSLNFDVLELIFAFLSGRDLPAIALKYPRVSTSFTSVLARPELAVHVRNIDVRFAPIFQGKAHPLFVRDCSRAVELCKNLRSIVYTPDTASIILPMLQGKSLLATVRLYANLTTDQAEMLLKLKNIQKLILDHGSWNVMDLLPRWMISIQKTLTSLTLFMSNDLNELVLERALRQLPGLTGLHIVGCPNIDHIQVLKLVIYTPLLESLAFTTTESACPIEDPPPRLDQLRELAIELRPRSSAVSSNPPSPSQLVSVLSHLKSSLSVLTSLSLKLPDSKTSTSQPIVEQLLRDYSHSLRKLFFVDCMIPIDSIMAIAKQCLHLEQLNVHFPTKDIVAFTIALSHSVSLHTLIDVGVHMNHGPQPFLKRGNVEYMMDSVINLRKIVSEGRIWTGRKDAQGNLRVSFERQDTLGVSRQWFMPHG